MIGNEGAKALAELLQFGDTAITHVDLSRNLIGEDGGQELLNALCSNTRIVEFEFTFGNPISNKLGRLF